MNKDEAKKWMMDNKLASSEFSAEGVWNGLELEGVDTEKQKELIQTYRKWRKISKNTKWCFAITLDGLPFPNDYEEQKKAKREATIKSLGFH